MSSPVNASRRGRVAFYTLDQDLRSASSVGIYNYSRRLIEELASRPDPGFDFFLLLSRANARDMTPLRRPAWMSVDVVDREFHWQSARMLADHIWLPRLLRRYAIDVVHVPKGYLPFRRPPGVRAIGTIHDAIPFHYRGTDSGLMRRLARSYFCGQMLRSLRELDAIATDSEFSRGELARLVPQAADKIRVIPPGPGIVAALRQPVPDKRGFLVMGSQSPHKATRETLRLLDSYLRARCIPEEIRITGLECWPTPWGEQPKAKMKFLERLDDPALAREMATARTLVFLSTVEGFGLPPLEAAYCGTPSCYRNTTSVREVMGGCPGAWNGDGEETFFRAMDDVLAMTPQNVSEMAVRLEQRFNWREAGGRFMALYQDQLGLSPGAYER